MRVNDDDDDNEHKRATEVPSRKICIRSKDEHDKRRGLLWRGWQRVGGVWDCVGLKIGESFRGGALH